jgi:hypothetical protein
MAKIPNKLISKVQYYHLLILGILILIGAVSCQASNQQAEVTPELDLTATAEFAAETLPTSTPSELASENVPPQQVDQCLACHTDKQALLDTADPVAVVESENSGEG